MVLALPQGILLDEIQDTMGREHKLSLFDYDGRLIKSKTLFSGQGPDEITVLTLENVWLSSSGKIMCQDNNYLKTLDPETFEIRTLKKFSNAIGGYGSKYTMGRHTYTIFEEKGNRTVTTVESAGYFENLTYHIAAYENTLHHFFVISKFKKPKPLLWAKIREGKRESYSDYYHFLRMFRIFSVDWIRDVVYTIPDIEKPEISFVNLKTKREGKLLIDLDEESFKIDKKEFEFKHEYVIGETSPELKSYYRHILYLPSHAPALMGIKVMEDRLIIITGKRDWKMEKNEALVYRLPHMKFEGSFAIPYPNLLRTKWYDHIYILEKLIKKNDDYFYCWEIYRINIK